ncbi:MAG: hypothetical protein DIZ80_15135 [endosymbiont of Galathealinum brachiosum]|uniref:SH3b domain-containing protein n=1 Tax=endosymbiont of Galathealinum brachiosum TaxID=2200906 RepID=A0A370D965_9GAMM|nr:MAG: hypothetical protein DIZ80_15135 [endosymbiont of Galathealinum brachiosum]
MILIRICVFNLIISFSSSVLACGTVDNWMDAYEGIDTGNQWRDSMNQLESLVMLLGCGRKNVLSKEQSKRLSHILNDALTRKKQVIALPLSNRDIREKVSKYKNRVTYEGLLESLFRSNHCLLSESSTGALIAENENKSLLEYFGSHACPGYKTDILVIVAPNGGRLRASPEGRVIATVQDGTKLKIVGKVNEWYRVIKSEGNELMIAYVHESITKKFN